MGTSRHFAFFGGVPISILYDNLKIAVARILGDGKRQRTRAFTELVSHYLFQERFGRPGKGNDKGKVEALVKYSRANFLTPVPHAASFDTLNAALEERCRARQAERAGRHEQTIGERLVADQAVLRALPEPPFEPCDKHPAKVSSTALVRYRMNDYSAPTAYGFRDVLVKGFVDEVAIICGASEIARHLRVYGRGQFVFDPKRRKLAWSSSGPMAGFCCGVDILRVGKTGAHSRVFETLIPDSYIFAGKSVNGDGWREHVVPWSNGAGHKSAREGGATPLF
jgi:hypothetical protein